MISPSFDDSIRMIGWLDDHQLYLAQNLIRCPRKHASSGPRLAPPDIGPQAAKWDGSPTATSMNWVTLSHSPWFLLKIHPTSLIHPCGKLWRAPCGIQDLSTKTAKEFLGAAVHGDRNLVSWWYHILTSQKGARMKPLGYGRISTIILLTFHVFGVWPMPSWPMFWHVLALALKWDRWDLGFPLRSNLGVHQQSTWIMGML